MKSFLVSTAIAAIALALSTTASAAALSDILDVDTTSIEELIPGADINILTGGSNASGATAGMVRAVAVAGRGSVKTRSREPRRGRDVHKAGHGRSSPSRFDDASLTQINRVG